MAQIQNKQNRDQQYLAVRVGRGPQPLAIDSDTYKAESSDYIEDICPYATFQLSKPAYSESSYSGNVYSGPYHSVRGSFVYHDVKPPPIDKFKLGHVSFTSFLFWLNLFCMFSYKLCSLIAYKKKFVHSFFWLSLASCKLKSKGYRYLICSKVSSRRPPNLATR